MKMERGGKSGVLRKKSSSGCLILKKKKKNDDGNSGGGFGGFSDNSKGRKRARLAASYLSSSDKEESLELMRRKVNEKRLNNGSVRKVENIKYDKDNGGVGNGGMVKRSRMDLYEFDEYDEFDGNKMRNEYLENRSKTSGQSGSGNMKEFGIGLLNRNSVVGKRKKESNFDGSSSRKSKGLERNKGLGWEEDDANMPISLLRLKYQQNGDQPIRLQGKNGVLKFMVNKKKKTGFASDPRSHDGDNTKERKCSRSGDGVEVSAQSPVEPSTKSPENISLSVVKEERRRKLGKVKTNLNKGSDASDSDIGGTNMVLRPITPGVQSGSLLKGMKKEEERSPDPENTTPVESKEAKVGKAKHGRSTEKQMLREKIRGMLVEAGWTIDYRPRRNRDYLDAVYTNPNGTAYWSIIKAYDALKEQLGEDNGKSEADVSSPSFAPLSEDLINKLTRQTKKKIGGVKRKRKEDGLTNSPKKSAVRETTYSSDSDQNEGSYMKPNYKSRSGKGQNSKSSNVQGRTSKVIGRCTLLVRGSEKGKRSDSDGYVPYKGKRTVLAWLIDTGAAKLSEKVQYMNRRRTRVMLEGWLTRDGIHCGCCSKILTVSKFELHAGSKLRQPFQNTFLESGSSLLQCQVDAWNSQPESARQDFHFVDVDGDDPDDDTCGICGDGGDLVCCDSCPSTFHQLCLEIQMLPSGDWHCPNCTCKFCAFADGNVAEKNDTIGNELYRCSFCEKKYHKSCYESVDAATVSLNGVSFCGIKCQELFDHLRKILGLKHELEAGFSWSLIQRTDVPDASDSGFAQRVECNSKLAVALSVMDECFLPIIDRRSGINIIQNVVYNCRSNFNRLNYCGFYTVILERGDEIISAASVRLHGTHLAEMPFIGTREIYRRQGMCRRLLSAIENELSSLKVEKLVIPAISEHMNTWTTGFGFHELDDVDKKEIKSLSMLVFPGTDMLQKQFAKQENSDVGMKVSESISNLPVLVEKSEVGSPPEQTGQSSSDSEGCHKSESSDEFGAMDDSSLVPTVPSNDHTPANVAVHVSDNLAGIQGTIAVKFDVESKQKVSSAHLKHSPHAWSNYGSDIEHQLLDHPARDSLDSSAEALVGSQSKSEGPCLELVERPSGKSLNATKATMGSPKSTSVTVNAGSLMNVSAYTCTQKNVKSGGSSESLPSSVLVTSSQSTADKVNGESVPASCLETVANKEPLEQFNQYQMTAPVLEAELHPAVHPSPDSTATYDAKAGGAGGIEDSSIRPDAHVNEREPDDAASCLKENGSPFEVSLKDTAGTASDKSTSCPNLF